MGLLGGITKQAKAIIKTLKGTIPAIIFQVRVTKLTIRILLNHLSPECLCW